MMLNEKNSSSDEEYNKLNEKLNNLNEKIDYLLKEIDSLNNKYNEQSEDTEIKCSDIFYDKYGVAGNFCGFNHVKYFLNEGFEEDLINVTKHLNTYEDQRDFKYFFLRAMFVSMINWETLYFQDELNDQKKFSEFKRQNINENINDICGFNFIGDYNIHAFMNDQFDDEDKEFLRNKDIMDAGAFSGDTSLPLSTLTNKNVYAFEPFEDSFNLMKENIMRNNVDNIIPIKKSLGNINGERSLFLSGTNVQGITSDPNYRSYDQELKVQEVTVDTFVEENNLDVGYITVDIEGAEMNLLEGAINTIKTQKPILTISIYHTISDYFSIIPWIADLDLGYEFKLIKEQPWAFLADTTVLCRVKDK